MTLPESPARPRLRGVIHRWAALALGVTFAGLAGAAAVARDAAAAAWVSVYGLCVTAMLAVSATYHSGRLSPPAQQAFRRADHAMILVAIAGSYTGIVGLALGGATRTLMLVVVWIAASIGVGIRMLWLHAPSPLTAAVYVIVGWVALLDIGAFSRSLTATQLALVVAGGVLYSIGAGVYALRRPNPWPATFGYHEVFHALVVIAAVVHLAAVALLIAGR